MIDVDGYREQGFALARGFFERREIERIQREAQEVFTVQMRRHGIVADERPAMEVVEAGMFDLFERDLQTFTNCGKQAQHLISLHRLSLDPRITDALGELGLRAPNISTRPVLYFNHPRLAKKEVYWRLDSHQDWRSMQGSLDACVVWIPLVDIARDLGALEVAPASHLDGLVPADMEDGYAPLRSDETAADMVPVEVERGDALFFSALLLHRSGTNVTDRIRWSCHFRYNNLDEPTFVERGYPHPYVYHPQSELITRDFPSRAQVAAALLRPQD